MLDQGRSHVDQNEQPRPSIDNWGAARSPATDAVPRLGGRMAVRRPSGLSEPSGGQEFPLRRRSSWRMGSAADAIRIGVAHAAPPGWQHAPPHGLVPDWQAKNSLDQYMQRRGSADRPVSQRGRGTSCRIGCSAGTRRSAVW